MAVAPKRISKFLSNVIQNGPVPEHIAFIMDGNRQYAKRRGVKALVGHYRGGDALVNILEFCFELGVGAITVYALSIENFKRSKEELEDLKFLMQQQFAQNGTLWALISQYDFSIRLLGRLELLDDSTRETLLSAVNQSRHGTGGIFNVCVAYTSQDEMTRAMKKTVENCSSLPSGITSQSLTENLDTADHPLPDILIRTSGVTRLSDFLLWQCNQDTDIQFVDRLWPEFKPWDLFLIIARWQRSKSVSERGQPKRSRWRKACHGPESAHIRLISAVFIMFLVLVVI